MILHRLARVIVGLLWLSTIVFTIIPSVILWIFIGRNLILDVADWVATGEYP